MPKKELINRIEYISFRGLLAVLRCIPKGIVRRLLIALFLFVGYFIGIRKNVARMQLAKVYPGKSSQDRKKILKNIYRGMALTIFEVYFTKDDVLYQSSTIEGIEHVQAALAMGRGAILATAHYGNWEAARVLPKAGIPLSVITKTQRNHYFDDYTNKIRERCGVKTINMRKGLRDIVSQLHQGRMVAILMDQNAGSSGLVMDFLGFPASNWKGVAKLSLRYRVPIVPGFAHRNNDDSLTFKFFPYILEPTLEDSEENYPVLLGRVNRIIEKMINECPQQWFWVHKRWKHTYDMFS